MSTLHYSFPQDTHILKRKMRRYLVRLWADSRVIQRQDRRMEPSRGEGSSA